MHLINMEIHFKSGMVKVLFLVLTEMMNGMDQAEIGERQE